MQLQANCRERDVFLIQPLVPPVQENLVELLLMLDAARGASAGRITVVMPHYAYARSDKKDAPRISIGGRLVADLLATAGADRVLAMTLHSPQVHGFFSVPVDHLHALRELADHFRRYDLSNTVVVSPDLGNAKEAAAFARLLGTPVAAGAKQRFSDDRVKISAVIGDVADRDVIVLDDEIAKGSTVIELLDHLRERKVRSIRVACTHGLFSDGALERLSRPGRTSLEIVCTNTVPIPADKRVPKLHGAVGRAGAGRGDAPHPQRRVGQRPVRPDVRGGGPRRLSRARCAARGWAGAGADPDRGAGRAGDDLHRVAQLAGQPEAPAAGGVRGGSAAVAQPLRADPVPVVGDLADQHARTRARAAASPPAAVPHRVGDQLVDRQHEVVEPLAAEARRRARRR